MPNIFRGRLASKNQMTIPPQMQHALNMVRGDELEFYVEGCRITQVNVLKPVPADLLGDDILAELKKRRANSTEEREISPAELAELTGEEKTKKETKIPAAAAML